MSDEKKTTQDAPASDDFADQAYDEIAKQSGSVGPELAKGLEKLESPADQLTAALPSDEELQLRKNSIEKESGRLDFISACNKLIGVHSVAIIDEPEDGKVRFAVKRSINDDKNQTGDLILAADVVEVPTTWCNEFGWILVNPVCAKTGQGKKALMVLTEAGFIAQVPSDSIATACSTPEPEQAVKTIVSIVRYQWQEDYGTCMKLHFTEEFSKEERKNWLTNTVDRIPGVDFSFVDDRYTLGVYRAKLFSWGPIQAEVIKAAAEFFRRELKVSSVQMIESEDPNKKPDPEEEEEEDDQNRIAFEIENVETRDIKAGKEIVTRWEDGSEFLTTIYSKRRRGEPERITTDIGDSQVWLTPQDARILAAILIRAVGITEEFDAEQK